MAAAALPAARQITRPFGTGRRCAASTTSGCAAATAASKIVRRRGRLSVMVSRDLRWKHATPLSIRFRQKKTPAEMRGEVNVRKVNVRKVSCPGHDEIGR